MKLIYILKGEKEKMEGYVNEVSWMFEQVFDEIRESEIDLNWITIIELIIFSPVFISLFISMILAVILGFPCYVIAELFDGH